MGPVVIGIWLALTFPATMSVLFALLKPVLAHDKTGIGMLALAFAAGLLDLCAGMLFYRKIVRPWLDRRGRKKHFP